MFRAAAYIKAFYQGKTVSSVYQNVYICLGVATIALYLVRYVIHPLYCALERQLTRPGVRMVWSLET